MAKKAKKAAKKAAPKKAAKKKAAPKKAAKKAPKKAAKKAAPKKKSARKPNAAFMAALTPSESLGAVVVANRYRLSISIPGHPVCADNQKHGLYGV